MSGRMPLRKAVKTRPIDLQTTIETSTVSNGTGQFSQENCICGFRQLLTAIVRSSPGEPQRVCIALIERNGGKFHLESGHGYRDRSHCQSALDRHYRG